MLNALSLPHDYETERSYLSALVKLRDGSARQLLLAETSPDLFGDPAMRRALDVVVENAATLDVPTFAAGMAEKPVAASIIATPAPHTADGAEKLRLRLAELAYRRALIQDATIAGEELVEGRTPPAVVADQLTAGIEMYRQRFEVPERRNIETACKEFDAFKAGLTQQSKIINTGIQELDAHGGLPPEYVLLLARSSVGKTALALTLAVNAAVSGKRTLFWSGEQLERVIVAKIISILTGLSGGKVSGIVATTPQEAANITAAREIVPTMPIELWGGERTVSQLAAHAIKIQAARGLDAVFLDQFDRIIATGNPKAPREEKLAEISRRVFSMQQRLDVPVIMLAQLGIKHQKDNPVPEIWHVRDCSQVIQDADRAYLIDRPEAEPERWDKMLRAAPERARALEGRAVIRLEKNRNGIGGKWEERVLFDSECGRFGRAIQPSSQVEIPAEWERRDQEI